MTAAGLPLILLRGTARLFGLQPSYIGKKKNVLWTSSQILNKAIAQLSGVEIKTHDDLNALFLQKKESILEQIIAPVIVTWNEAIEDLYVTVPHGAGGVISLVLEGENLRYEKQYILQNLPVRSRSVLDKKFFRYKVPVHLAIPHGYYSFSVVAGERISKSFLISAPKDVRPVDLAKRFGVFVSIDSLRSSTDMGIGSIKELKMIARIMHEYGADYVFTSPIEPIHIDLDALIEKAPSLLKKRLKSAEFKREAKSLRERKFIDYDAVRALQAKTLTLLAESHGPIPYEKYVEQVLEQQLKELHDEARNNACAKLIVDVDFLRQASRLADLSERRQGYQGLRDYLRRQFQYGHAIRIKNIEGCYCVPMRTLGVDELPCAYLRRYENEIFAVLCVEVQRANAWIIAEDMDASSHVRDSLRRLGVLRSWVYVRECTANPAFDVRKIPKDSLVMLNAPGTYSLDAYLQFFDLDQAIKQGALQIQDAAKHKMIRRKKNAAWAKWLELKSKRSVKTYRVYLESLLEQIMRSESSLYGINIEDIWGEYGHQSWGDCRRYSYGVEELLEVPYVRYLICKIKRFLI